MTTGHSTTSAMTIRERSASMKLYWVYILASKKHGVLYTGVTNNLAARVMQHRNGEGSKFAKKYWALRLVYAQPFEDVNEAIAAEKNRLIERENPDWRDLMEDRGHGASAVPR
jgi:putative endonuclease